MFNSKIGNMSLFCAILVVMHHFSVEPDGFYSPLAVFLAILGKSPVLSPSGGLVYIAVPVFFVVSGYFVSKHIDEDNWHRRIIRKRASTLLLPFVFWILVSLFYVSLLDFVRGRDLYFGSVNALIKGSGLYLPRIVNPVASQLWYVRSLLLFVLCLPLIRHVAKTIPLVICFMTYAFVSPFENGCLDELFRFGVPLEGLFFFSLGIWLKNHPNVRINNKLTGVVLVCSGVFFQLVRYFLALKGFVISPYAGWAATLTLLPGCWILMPSKELPHFFYSMPFPVYLMHRYILLSADNVLSRFGSITRGGGYSLVLFSAVALPAGMAWIMRQSMRLRKFAFGDR